MLFLLSFDTCLLDMTLTKQTLTTYVFSFKKFVAIADEEMKQHKNSIPESEPESVTDRAVRRHEDEVFCLVNDLLDPSTGCFSYKPLQKYKCIGETFYQEACDLERKIHCFETNIRRSYFHVMPLDDNQLQNWHQYLDFVEKQDDFDWVSCTTVVVLVKVLYTTFFCYLNFLNSFNL